MIVDIMSTKAAMAEAMPIASAPINFAAMSQNINVKIAGITLLNEVYQIFLPILVSYS
jgi:hypothetical protein